MKERITIVGNVAATPELRRMPSGDAVVSFRVGVTERRQDKQTSQWVDGNTSWYRVNAFRGLAENIHRSIGSGDRVVVSGRFSLQEWETDTKKGVSAEIEAEAVGHDLRWGTTAYTRTAARSGDATEHGGSSLSGPVDEDGWAAPGAVGQEVSVGSTPF
ncbi:single-stranded DNA-binding protein [Microbacterium sp. BG28]|uniref:single-stranded DNA-binding protein n=1 Tax=Microbacterium sp. BG28 TaxID=3097356 RepID=UPI002A59EF00|nr:single-stranded DNA-binding protein [Microbacterium sp. BG28]MDY0829157.1 single-stranded DNA-binding protein [Microbacterium sp. BG28]